MASTVLIVQPDADWSRRIGELILAGTPDAALTFTTSPQEGIAALQNFSDLDLCVCEVYFADGDGLAFLAAVRSQFRRARVIVATNYNLQFFGDHLQGLTVFPMPLDEQVFLSTCEDTLSTLEGQTFPPFRLGKKQPPDRWGDCYAAYDTGVKRDVFITITHPWATPEDCSRFRNTAAAMARASHPNVQAVYQAGDYQGRDFFCREKWDMPNLAELATAGQGIDPRLAAQIVHTVGAVIMFWDTHQFPHGTVGATDVSLSPQGVVKVANCVDPTKPATEPGMADLTQVGNAVHALLGQQVLPGKLARLLSEVRSGPVFLAKVISDAQAIDVELTPEREIAVSEEHHIAQQEISLARKKQKLATYLIFAGFGAAVLFVLYILYSIFLAEPPSREFNEMIAIPAGPYVYQAAPAVLDHTFYIDKYEVTFGQYIKFLKAVRKAGTDQAWRHPLQNGEKDHEPKDWEAIFQAIKYRQLYANESLTADDPVFNVDWYDAQAYAKWAGKRLPTEEEWEKAARGTTGYFFPWGNNFAPKANTSVNNSDVHNHEIVDQMPDDVSPYGVYDMAGNVSEWTDTLAPGSIVKSVQVAVIRGGNFKTNVLEREMLTRRNTDWVPETRQYWLGFRCASDTPPQPPK